MSEKYPDSTLDVKFQSIEDKLDEHFEATTNILRDVVTQTTKTNGKVAELSKTQERQKGFNSAAVIFLTVVIVPLLGVGLWQVFENSQHIAAIDAVLTQILNKP